VERTGEKTIARYATSFSLRLLSARCEVDVVADLVTRQCSSTVSMLQALSTRPAFSISRENLWAFAKGAREICGNAALLTATVAGSTQHQLNLTVAGATLIVVQPAKHKARFALSVGMFHREGDLEELPIAELEAAVREMESLEARVSEKLANASRDHVAVTA